MLFPQRRPYVCVLLCICMLVLPVLPCEFLVEASASVIAVAYSCYLSSAYDVPGIVPPYVWSHLIFTTISWGWCYCYDLWQMGNWESMRQVILHTGLSKRFLNANPGSPCVPCLDCQPLLVLLPKPASSHSIWYSARFTDTPHQPPTGRASPAPCRDLRLCRLWNLVILLHSLNLSQPDSFSFAQGPSLQFLNLPLSSLSSSLMDLFPYNSNPNLSFDCVVNITHAL